MKKGNEVNSTSDLVKAHTLPNVGHTGEERWEELWEDFWMDCTDLWTQKVSGLLNH